MNTNYLVLNPTTKVYEDLSQIFVRRSPTSPMSPPTGITFYNTETGENDDINTIFHPLTEGMLKLPYNTNIMASNVMTSNVNAKNTTTEGSNATEISNIYGSQPISVDDNKKYTIFYDDTTSFYTVVFVSNGYSSDASTITNDEYKATLTFVVDVNKVQWTVVGGGGGGGNASSNCQTYAAGGGAGGCVTTNSSVKSYIAGTKFNIVVGAGGKPKKTGGTSSALPTSGTGYKALGGAYGLSTTDNCSSKSWGGTGTGGGGNGGVGGSGAGGAGTGAAGSSGSYLAIMSGGEEYYFGGGGAGGTCYEFDGITYGGSGGGQGGCSSPTFVNDRGNNNKEYKGPNYLYYAQAIYMASGYPGTGGGGAGGSGNNGDITGGYQGGSGIVICTFKTA